MDAHRTKKSKGERVARRAIVYLVLGAVISLALAELRAMWAREPWNMPGRAIEVIAPEEAQLPAFMSEWPRPLRAQRVEFLGLTSVDMLSARGGEAEVPLAYDSGDLRARVVRTSYGWPMRCVESCWVGLQGESRAAKRAEFDRHRRELGWRLLPQFPRWIPFVDQNGKRLIPTFIVAAGLAVDAGFWGGVLCLVPWAWRRMRTEVRVRKGQCAACGYTVGVLVVCPECGRASSNSNVKT